MTGRRLPITVLLVSLLVWGSALGNGGASAYSIKSISAQFYYEEEGRLGASDLFEPFTALWNAFIGAGDAEAPTSTILILIHIKGPSFRRAPGTLIVNVKEGSASLLKRRVPLASFYGRGTELILPFFVSGPRCEPLQIMASLRGTNWDGKKITATLPFMCGE